MPFSRSIAALANLLVVTSGAVFGQSTPLASPEFEVTEVKANHSGLPGVQGGILPGGQVSVRNIPMKDLILQSFKAGDVAGGPNWLESERFDIVAKAPPNTPEDTLRLMLRNLLSERFKLAVHQEQRMMPVYAMVAVKGKSKLQPAAGSGRPACHPGQGAAGLNHTVCTNFTMADLASWLSTRIAPSFIDLPVIDHTGFQGTYDLQLDWVPRRLADADAAAGATVFDALEKQLGLKLEERKEPRPVIIIDHIERLPIASQ